MFLQLASGDYVNISAAVCIKRYDDPAIGSVFRIHFTEREIITVSDPEDVEKVGAALNRLVICHQVAVITTNSSMCLSDDRK